MVIEELHGRDPRRDELLGRIVAAYVGKSNLLIWGEKRYASKGKDVKPYISGDTVMFPCEIFAESIGVASDGCAAFATERDSLGRAYAPIETLCSAFNLYLHTEINGLMIYSREDLSELLDWNVNMRLMRNISEAFVFDDFDGEYIRRRISERYPDNRHPRLIFTEDKLGVIRREVVSENGDRVYKKIFADIKEFVDGLLNTPPYEYGIPDGIRMLHVCNGNATHMLLSAAAYLVSGEEKYAERAYRTMLHCASFKDFNPYHFLDVGELAVALGLTYDWLYYWMGEEKRRPIREAIITKAIYPMMEDLDELPRERSWNWRGELADNWRFVISGIAVACMSVIDELECDDLIKAERIIEQQVYDIRRSLSLFAPYGAYEEGHAYWYYGIKHYSYLVSSLITAVGEDFGYIDVPGMKMTNNFMFAMNGPVSTFDYHDCDLSRADGNNIPPETMLFARYFGKSGEAQPRIEKILSEPEKDSCRRLADLYLYDLSFSNCDRAQMPLDSCLPIAEVATMRTGFDKKAMWLGFHCDDPIGGEGHDHMDSGAFVLDAMGERFFFDFGKDDYTLPNYLNCYRVREEGHNVIVINPDEGYSMEWGGEARICEYGSSSDCGYAIGELSRAYRKSFKVTRYQRCASLDRVSRRAVIRDELDLEIPAEIYWFAHTRAEITLTDGGKKALLRQNGKTLVATIEEGDGAVFSVLPARPLPTSPVIEGQDPNDGVCKLTIHLTDCKSLRITVSFTCG